MNARDAWDALTVVEKFTDTAKQTFINRAEPFSFSKCSRRFCSGASVLPR